MTTILAMLLAVAMQAGTPAMRTIAKGDQSTMDDAKQAVARTPAEWQALWRQHDPERRPPAVDFTKEMVIGVFLGSRPTAGWVYEIVSAASEGETLVVRYREIAPPPGGVTAQVLTSYFHLVAVPKTSATVRFEKIQK
ncbi:MAG: protease complex subunit PrcB family protein [Acidobacteriia bacterium]|nr:protease complex subunit PrcB family protein [Terriglobia bacterium]